MAAIDLPFNNPALYYLSARRLPAAMLGPTTGPAGPTTSSSSATAAHPELSSTTPRKNSSNNNNISNSSSGAAAAVLGSTVSDPNAAYPSSTSATALASLGANASPTDVLLTLPPPILRLLVVSSPFISFLTTISQLLTWTHPNRYAPFFLPVLWTVACMGGEYLLRFGLNGLLLAILGVGWIVRKGAERRRLKGEPVAIANRGVAATINKESPIPTSSTSTSIRETSNVRTLTLGTSSQPAIQVLTPSALNLLLAEASILSKHTQILYRTFSPVLTPFTWKDEALSWNATYFLLNSYPYYLLITYFVPMRLILLVLGLVALLWEAPWFAVVRKSLWSSALFRRTCRVGVTLLRGELYSVKIVANNGPNNVGVLTRWQTFKQIWKDAKTEDVNQKAKAKSIPSNDTNRGRSRSIVNTKAISKYEDNIVEIQYLFSIFENQRWWIGLEWTQALLPNERPSWSDPTHAPCSPPGSFQLPPPSTVYISATRKRTFTWKWSDPEWRIRGTAGVLISPSTIGANPNPVNTSNSSGVASGTAAATAASMSEKAAKDLKDAMGSLGDWKQKLSSRRDTEDKERRNSSDEKGNNASSANSNHARKGSASFFGDSFNALVGAKDEKSPVAPAQDGKGRFSSSAIIDDEASSSNAVIELDPGDNPDLLGHPTRIDEITIATSDPEAKTWEVDAQGWVYTDNQWEKPTSKGGMGRYTRRRAWVRRAVVVEKVEDVNLDDEVEREQAISAAARLGLSTKLVGVKRSESRESKKEK